MVKAMTDEDIQRKLVNLHRQSAPVQFIWGQRPGKTCCHLFHDFATSAGKTEGSPLISPSLAASLIHESWHMCAKQHKIRIMSVRACFDRSSRTQMYSLSRALLDARASSMLTMGPSGHDHLDLGKPRDTACTEG